MGVILRKMVTFFSFFHMVSIMISAYYLVERLAWHNLFIFMMVLYCLPPLAFRIQNIFAPLEEGEFDFSKKAYCPWWGAHQMQQVYAAVPHLEGILRIVPGLYSCWLRLWGAKIGKNVYWTPRVEIIDRMLIEVGDYTIFGHQSACCSHLISKKNNTITLKITKVRFGKSVLVGAGSRLGPGTKIYDNIQLPVCTDLLMDQHIQSEAQLKKVHHDPILRTNQSISH